MNSPQSKGDEDLSDMSSLKRKLAAAKLQDEMYDNDTKVAVTAEVFRRVSQQVVSVAVSNAIDKMSTK